VVVAPPVDAARSRTYAVIPQYTGPGTGAAPVVRGCATSGAVRAVGCCIRTIRPGWWGS